MWPFDRKKREQRRQEERQRTTRQSLGDDSSALTMGALLGTGVVSHTPPDSSCTSFDSPSSCDSGGGSTTD